VGIGRASEEEEEGAGPRAWVAPRAKVAAMPVGYGGEVDWTAVVVASVVHQLALQAERVVVVVSVGSWAMEVATVAAAVAASAEAAEIVYRGGLAGKGVSLGAGAGAREAE